MENSRKPQSTEPLEEAIHACLCRYCVPGQHLTVAFSGGVDSSVLLDVLCRRQEDWGIARISAVHVHHGLSPDADDWVEHCARECRQRGVPLLTQRVTVARMPGWGVEALARHARYQALSTLDADWILLGHHSDDQAETVLLNLLRGAGVLGAAAMAEMRGKYLRPLLGTGRDNIRTYAKRHGLSWIEDGSNTDDHFRRNFLRTRIFPLLRERFPAAGENLSRAAQSFLEAGALLEQLALLDQGAAGPLRIERLRELDRMRAMNLLVFHLRRHGIQIPSRNQIEELLRQLTEASEDRQPRFVMGEHEIHRHRGAVCFTQRLPGAPDEVEWQGADTVPWGSGVIVVRFGQGQGISRDLLKGTQVRFSPRKGGEKLRLHPGGPRRPLKDLLREAGIAPWLRKRLPLMYCGSDLVWVPGVGMAAEYRCAASETGVLLEFSEVNW